ncbi:MAG: hypothetical protein AB9872_15620 [Solidesulfovibrio sp.]
MDAVSGVSLGTMATATDKQTFGAQVVSGTLNQMNTDQSGHLDPDFDFQTKVLSTMSIGNNLNISG